MIEDVLFLSIQILCSKFIGISDVDVTLSQVKKYDNKLVDFVDRMLKVIRDILDVDLTSDEKVKESLIIHLRPTIFRLRYGTPQKNALIDFIKKNIRMYFVQAGRSVFCLKNIMDFRLQKMKLDISCYIFRQRSKEKNISTAR